ncbi:MAG TPA: SMC-Scp complex subunit ScpB [Candidatus Moranbacteria bacterium]|nr:SMC-Scp complex subunit ScpB [Candidatus Moranbacteria bacterium]
MEIEKIQSIIESVLFISGEPVKKSKLEKLFGGEVKIKEIETALDLLSEKYGLQSSGLMLLKKGDEVQIVSNPENAQHVEKLVKNELQESLSTAASEVVSIIAYRGPISKTEIEAIRGVNCAYTLRNLLLRGLVERNDNFRGGRGYVYSISFDFLKKMGIDDVKKLPKYDTLSVDERINSIVES